MSTEPEIGTAGRVRVSANGPYIVEGDVPLAWRIPVATEHDEPIAWRGGPAIEHNMAYALCRCGGSSNKPFCDGTHNSNGFDGTETDDPTPRADRQRVYEGDGMVMLDDRSICTHAGFCGDRVSNVWQMIRETGDTQVRARVVAMIERCPSGALSYEIEGEAIEPELRNRIGVTPDGPLWLTGGIPVERSDGTTLETRNRVTLCRCGLSATKPLCDGAHQDAGFTHRPD